MSAAIINLMSQEVNKIRSDLWKNCVKHVTEVKDSYVSSNFQVKMKNFEYALNIFVYVHLYM